MKQLLYTLLFLIAGHGPVLGQYNVANLPSPKEKGQDYFVSNPDGILSSFAVDTLNAIALEIERRSSAEIAVVVVNDFKGDDDFEFAFNLFNSWGIGKKENDNGLLLFIAKDRRAYRFITGYGMEPVLPDGMLRSIGEQHLLPYFKKGKYDDGVLAAMDAIRSTVLSVGSADELKAASGKQTFFQRYQQVLIDSLLIMLLTFAVLKWISYVADEKIIRNKRRQNLRQNGISLAGGLGCMALTLFIGVFVILFAGAELDILFLVKWVPWYLVFAGSIAILIKSSKAVKHISKAFRDDKNRMAALGVYYRWTLIPLLLSPFALLNAALFLKRRKAMQERFIPPDDSGNWVRLDRDKLKKNTDLLDKGRHCEESLFSRSYQLWKHRLSGAIKVIGWDGKKSKKYSACPDCSYITLKRPFVKTIVAATSGSEGKGERMQECEHCTYNVSLGAVVIPQKATRSSSTGGSGSSSGSFGGGSSGGGGAGGRW